MFWLILSAVIVTYGMGYRHGRKNMALDVQKAHRMIAGREK